MKLINELTLSLNQQFNWNKSRMDCFVRMLLGLISVRSVNLQEIATAFDSEVEISSRYRRIQRFFAFFKLDYTQLSLWLFLSFFNKNEKLYILIDRTNWYWGKSKINIFMLSIAYEGIAIPICWELLDKAGCSNLSEQKKLINRFIQQFGMHQIAGVLADREFIGSGFLAWLTKKKIPFYIRIKENTQLLIKGKKWKKAKQLFKALPPNHHQAFMMSVEINQVKVFLAASLSVKREWMIVATNQKPGDAIAIYLRRWEIETLFQSLKCRGFRFEDTHLTHPERIAKLIALMAVGFTWAHKVGEWKDSVKPIRLKRLKTFLTVQQRPANTFFRYGLDFLRDCILHPHNRKQYLKQLISLFYPPGSHPCLT